MSSAVRRHLDRTRRGHDGNQTSARTCKWSTQTLLTPWPLWLEAWTNALPVSLLVGVLAVRRIDIADVDRAHDAGFRVIEDVAMEHP
jgi:hypothetical protein